MGSKKTGKHVKTNVMRVFDQHGVKYESHYYGDTDAVAGLDVAGVLGQDPDNVYKTLVTEGHSGEHYVFLVPVSRELNLKKAAKAVGEKSIEMIKSKELLPLTGYIHGGCSPVGMKKTFCTVINENAGKYDTIMFSAGKIGCQVETSLSELKKVVDYALEDIVD